MAASELVDFNMFFIDDLFPALRPRPQLRPPEIDLILLGQQVNSCMQQRPTAAQSCMVCILSPLFQRSYTKQGAVGHPEKLTPFLRIVLLVIHHGPTDLRRPASVLSFMSE